MKPLLLIMLASLLGAVGSANAASISVSNPASLTADTIIDWGPFGRPYSAVATPLTVIMPNVTVTVSEPAGSFERRDQAVDWSSNVGGWWGHFAPGEHLLWTEVGDNSIGNGPMTLTFSRPVFGFGVQIEADSGLPDFYLDAFDGTTNLGTFHFVASLSGSACCDNTAPFIGVLSDQADITSVVLSVGNSGQPGINDFAIAGPRIQTGAGTVPEPGTVGLLAAAMGMIALRSRRRLR